jgi:ATP-binding cassette, subfamily B, multidrug efflux pump
MGIISVKPRADEEHAIKELTRLYGYMMGCRNAYLLGGLLLLLTNAFALLIPWLLKLAVQSFQHPGSGRSPGQYAGLIILAALLHGVIRIFSRTTMLNAGRTIEFRIREELYAKLLALDLPYFSRERTGDILSRFSNDLTNVRMLLGFGVQSSVNTCILYAAALVIMGSINPLLTLCAVAPFPLMIFLVKRVSQRIFRRSLQVQEQLAALSSQIQENVSAAAVIRGYCREEAQAAAFHDLNEQYLLLSMKLARLRGFVLPIMGSATGAGTLIVLFLGGSMVIKGTITLGDFVAFNGYLAMLVWPTVMMGWILNLIQRGAASLSRFTHLLDADATVKDALSPLPSIPVKGEIRFEGMTFSYGDNGAVLHDITLQLPAGAKTGIVGPVGSGKSTLVRLIARLFPVADGTLFIDGTDINRMELSHLREVIGFVPQEGFLFSRSIRENIAIGREGATEDEIIAATSLAQLDRDIAAFPDGYDTQVGERGVTLSGGQKQRAAIARALLANPSILILDDPLSSVDAATEAAILSGLAQYYGTRSVVIVSHRLSAVQGCDLILVIEEGRIVEQGRPAELLARGGRYAALYREQQLRQEIEGF